jgi:aryl-alcohol dehydrogenase-like predicted oxidoreductase
VIVATKFGNVFAPGTKQITGRDGSVAEMRRSLTDSLARLGTAYVDLLQLHIGDLEDDAALALRDALEDEVAGGRIRWYGWSTDQPDRARLFAAGPHCTAIQQALNLLGGNFETLAVCEQEQLASINRGPLSKGLLTGKFDAATTFPANDTRHSWSLSEGRGAEQLAQFERVKAALTADGRTLAQGALGWLWAKSPATVPIPGFKTVAQVEENAGAMAVGPLAPAHFATVERLLGRG